MQQQSIIRRATADPPIAMALPCSTSTSSSSSSSLSSSQVTAQTSTGYLTILNSPVRKFDLNILNQNLHTPAMPQFKWKSIQI